MKKILLPATLFLLCISPLLAQLPPPPEPELNCTSAVLLDFGTGRVLYEKHPDTPLPPASMTKLVTAYTFLKELENPADDLDAYIPVPEEADYRNAPPHSSLMFLEEGQRVTGRELLAGLMVPSGNDTAAAVALYVAGSVEAFAELMNRRMEELGLQTTRFVEPSGYSEYNITTAAEFARFCREYIRAFPKLSVETASLRELTYPEEDNLGDGGTSTLGPIRQENHNELIGRYAWADGLKTGYIEESGYNVALTAEKGGRRLVCVIMGIERSSGPDASMRRIIDGVNLLSYGFYAFTNTGIEPPPVKPVRIYGGRKKYLEVAGDRSPVYTLSLYEAAHIRREFIPSGFLTAPIEEGTEVGVWKFFVEDREMGVFPARAAETIEEGGFFRRIFGKIILWFRGGQ